MSIKGRLGGTACRHVLEVEYEYGVVPSPKIPES
jgi:hypothetical protein